MMKKQYITPMMEEVKIKQQYHLLAGSPNAVIDGGDSGSLIDNGASGNAYDEGL